jgi:O-antigen ligase
VGTTAIGQTTQKKMTTETTQPGWNAQGLKLLLVFVTVGFLLSLAIAAIASSVGSLGMPLVVAVILLAPPAIVVGVIGVKQGSVYLSEFWSGWSLGHWLILLLFISTLVFRLRDVAAVESSPVDAWAVLRLGPEAIVAGILLYQLLSHRTPWLRSLFGGVFGALAVYGLVCTLSSIWSVYASWTLYKSLEFLLDVSVFAFIVAKVKSVDAFRNVLNWVWAVYGLELVWTWIGAAIWRSEALDELGRLSGVWPVVASNSIGVSGAVISVVALARFLARGGKRADRIAYGLLFCFGFISLVASQTRNSLAGFIVGAFLVLLYERRMWIGAVAAALAVPAVLLTSLGPKLWDFLLRSQTETQVADLSGRTVWWKIAWDLVMQHPLTGLGAYAAGKFAILGKLGIGEASQIHSDWLEVMVGTSFWGLIPFVAAFLGCWWIIGRSYWDRSLTTGEHQLSAEILGVLGIISVRSFLNVELSWHAPFLYLAVVAYAEFLRRQKKERELGFNRRSIEI